MVTSVTSFGKSGLSDWIVQRVTAVVLGVYFLCMMGFFLFTSDLTYDQWYAYMTTTYMRIFTLIALVSLAAHGWIGVWAISTDYLTVRQLGSAGTAIRLVFQAVCALVAIVYVVWGIQILWGI